MTTTAQQKLTDLVSRLQRALGDRLVSVVLYGSAAMDDWHEGASDLNILCVTARLSARELADSEPVVRWWREQGNPPPLLLTSEELQSSTDCFAIEFHDMQERRRVLHGADLIDGLTIDRSFYRAQVEQQLRSMEIRLRQRAAEALPDSERLLRLLADSISTFCVLGRHALLLAGREARWKKPNILAALQPVLEMRLDAASAILALRGSKKPTHADPPALLDAYLAETDALVRFVDRLDR